MSNKPLLIFPTAAVADQRTALASAQQKPLHLPSKVRQVERIEDRFDLLFSSLENRRAFLQQNISGATPELVLVLEFIGTIDNFFNAVRNVPELEFLAEQEHLFGADDDFFTFDSSGERTDKELSGQMFLVMTNQTALRQLQTLWVNYKNDSWERTDTGRIAHGLAKFRDLFIALKDIRPYSVQDRLRDTGFENYIEEQRNEGNPTVKFEVEMFFSTIENVSLATSNISSLLSASDGQIIAGSEVVLTEINYHALVAEAPISVFEDLSTETSVSFLQCERVMHFRPVGQSLAGSTTIDNDLPQIETIESIEPNELRPAVALLDGYPMASHLALRNKVIVDDPDDFLNYYRTEEMLHGTSMASLIVNGELESDDSIPLIRPLYVRPIMHPDPSDTFNTVRPESIPQTRLPIDLIHRAVVRMMEGEHGEPATAPNVKLINLSIGDPCRPFHINISAWAKLIDWLSFKYNILFLISAGNYTGSIKVSRDETSFRSLPDSAKADLVFEQIKNSNQASRKILTPGEAINGITIGSRYSDLSGPVLTQALTPLYNSHEYLAPYSRIGFGYRRGIKPDVLNLGGRLPYRSDIRHSVTGETKLIIPANAYLSRHPGQKVATPGTGGDLTRVAYTSGTSNSTALTSRLGAQIYEVLEELNSELEISNRINKKYYAVLIKSLIIHGANWDNVSDVIRTALQTDPQISNQTVGDKISSFIGYGNLNSGKVLYCTDQRVTLLGFGEIKKDTGNIYTFPLPSALNQAAYKKRLTVTLAWISPLNFDTTKYRKASLYFDNLSYDRTRRSDTPFHLSNSNAPVRASQRGTIQHQVYEDSEIGYFVDGDNLSIKVNCKEDASGLRRELINYGLAVTLELIATTSVHIYEEIKDKVEVQSRIRQRT